MNGRLPAGRFSLVFFCLSVGHGLGAQIFYFGADQSYVNEMEYCGAVYKENGQAKDVYEIFEDHGCNLVRLRLWHTPDWYDDLNSGKRYSDYTDVAKSIARAKDHSMSVLLDFHLSDNWADPSKQLVPAAWLPVVDNLPVLQDSLYQYVYHTLKSLYKEGLLPEMVQIGNETNKGILLSPEDNQTYTLDWTRNAALFNRAIEAVRDITNETGEEVQVALHMAGPADIEWFVDQFHQHGVTDFDIIALSYYWAWHKPTTIPQTGEVIKRLKQKYPEKHVMIVETGYLWTTENADAAPNIINEQNPDYEPASPENQKRWLVDLTTEVINQGGNGVVYWEPSWVSTTCFNQWNQGSHQDHATFFDFNDNLLIPGGIEWMEFDYDFPTAIKTQSHPYNVQVTFSQRHMSIEVGENLLQSNKELYYVIVDSLGQVWDRQRIVDKFTAKDYSELESGAYIITVYQGNRTLANRKNVIF